MGVSSGKLLNIAGPYCGSMHDSHIFQQTNINNWLQQNNRQFLGEDILDMTTLLHLIRKKSIN
jgi:hypothetical protein